MQSGERRAHQLNGDHGRRLEGELATTLVEQRLERRSEQLHDERRVPV